MDLPPVLMALGATLNVMSPKGERKVAVEDLFTGYYETVLAKNELISEVHVPAQGAKRASYMKVTTGSADDWPALGVAAVIEAEGNTIKSARVVASAATAMATRLKSAEAVLNGKSVTDKLLKDAGDAAAEEAEHLVEAAERRAPFRRGPEVPLADLHRRVAGGLQEPREEALRFAHGVHHVGDALQEGVVLEVSARRNPSVAAAGSVQRNADALSQSFPVSDRYWTLGITATQNLYSGGGVTANVAGARLSREAATLDLKSVIQDSILGVRTAFYRVLLAGERIKVQEQNVTLLQQELKNATDRLEAGTASAFEKTRAEVALANARVPLITANNDRRLAIEALRQQLGFSTNTPENLRKIPQFLGALEYRPLEVELGTAMETARARRPELQRLGKLVEAGGGTADQAKRKLFFKYNENSRPIEIKDPEVGTLNVEYASSGEVKEVKPNKPTDRRVATQVASSFQNLLEIIRPAGVSLSF